MKVLPYRRPIRSSVKDGKKPNKLHPTHMRIQRQAWPKDGKTPNRMSPKGGRILSRQPKM